MATPMYSKEQTERMREKARRVQESQGGGGAGKWISFSGKNAIVEQGGDITIRITPRHDFYDKRYQKGKDGKVVDLLATGQYAPDDPCVWAAEHWWDGPDAKRARAWCLKSLGNEDAPCPVCEAAMALGQGTEEDRELADGIRVKEAFAYPVVLRKKMYGEDGLPDVRMLPVTGSLWTKISNICTGGGDEGFAKGDISDWKVGLDLKIHRPGKDEKEKQYQVTAADQRTPLFAKEDGGRWAGLLKGEVIPDVEATIRDEMLSYAALYEKYYGEKCPDEVGAGPSAMEGTDPGDDPFGAPGLKAQEIPPDAAGSDDFAFPGEEETPPPAPAAKPTSRPAAPPPRKAAAAAAPPARRRAPGR